MIALPLMLLGSQSESQLTFLSWLGLLLWSIGFFFEAVGDWQLKNFKKNPSYWGKILQTGLWRYSRHPNYFGEVVIWWGIFLIALAGPIPWWGIISPLTITVLILFISGIPLLEKGMANLPGWEEYRKRTSVFFPWPPRKRIKH